MNPLWLIAAYLIGLAAMALMQNDRKHGVMKLRDWVSVVFLGWILVPLVILVGFSFALGTGWKYIKKAW